MKLTVIGAGGVRTPLVMQSLLDFGERLPLTRVSLMDIDGERLELMRLACKPSLEGRKTPFELEWTADAGRAIEGADFIITTIRAGAMESRAIDEAVPLRWGVLGQETTGPGGFAMAVRTIPVILDYVALIRELSPQAWLLNFTNPAGIITEAVTRVAGFERAIGICDNPSAMVRAAAEMLSVRAGQLFPEYYGLNHLGWLRAVYLDGQDQLPRLLEALKAGEAQLPHLPFDPELVASLGAIPNEYLYFYYSPRQCVENLLAAGQSRAQQILPFNRELFANLARIRDEEASPQTIQAIYTRYLDQRHGTYFSLETGDAAYRGPGEEGGNGTGVDSETGDDASAGVQPNEEEGLSEAAEGYSAVALGVIAALLGEAATPILNVPNRGALPGMADDDVVEVTCYVGNGVVRPLAMGPLPDHALGLMKMVKAYERLTIQAAVERSYGLAVQALALHPLVPSYAVAKGILDDYLAEHGDYFPRLE